MIGIYELFLLLIFGVPWIIALVDILRSDFKGNGKIIWLLVVFFLSFVGAIAYFAIGRKQKIAKAPEKTF